MGGVDVQTQPTDPRPLLCDISLEYTDRANFAMQQNGIPLVNAIRLTARTAEPIDDVTLELSIANGDAASWIGRVARLDPDVTVLVEPHEFRLSAQALATRTEAERSEIVCRVSCLAGHATKSASVDLLAFDQWPGTGHYPEITAAFVTPNHPKVAELLGLARQAMRGLSDSDALDGYQSGSRPRASQLAEACFNAVASRGIGYINPPASFETTGQRVRLIDRVAREQLGTCFDLSLLMMSLWEQCGLHPLLLMPEGHAMPAIWTHEAHLPETVIDEPASIRNLIELGEVVPVEATYLTQPGATFGSAMKAAKARMSSPGSGFLAIDIRSARKRGVRPLPLRTDGQGGVDLESLQKGDTPVPAGTTIDRVALAERAERGADAPGAVQETPSQRIERWKTRLLDLSLRNRLLNFRTTGRSLALNVTSLADLEDRLADDDGFAILPKSDTTERFLKEEFDAGHLHTSEAPAETAKRLLNLYRIAKSSIEETGANVLYLALGFLKWYESSSSSQERLAPLILLPVTLTRTAAGAGYHYSLSLNDEPLRPNVTLLEKLRVEFGIATDGLDRLPEDDHGIDVELILRKIRAAIRSSPRWEVLETAALGLFSFNKFLMWKDLQDNAEHLQENRLVGHLVDRPGQDFDPLPFPKPEDLDEHAKVDDLLCTRDADSSQLVAIRAAADRRTFVLEGPPGTGKSQTIANVIADSLARGRRVLFVAEKMAALTVVRKRLEQDGLGPFCLELHSAKASKKEVLAQLNDGLRAADLREPDDWGVLRRDLATARDNLNSYVRELHEPRATGESLYRMLGRLSLIGDGPTIPSPTATPAATTAEELGRWRRLIAELQQRARPINPPDAFPLRGIGQSTWSFTLPQTAQDALTECRRSADELLSSANGFLRDAGTAANAEAAGRQAIHALAIAASLLLKRSAPDRRFVHGPGAAQLRRRLLDLIAVGRERDAIRQQILQRYREEFLSLDPLERMDTLSRHLKQPPILRLLTAPGLRKSLRKFANADLPPLVEVAADLELVRKLQQTEVRLRADPEVVSALSHHWNDGAANWADLEDLCRWCEGLAKVFAAIEADDAMIGCTSRLVELASGPENAAFVKASGRGLTQAWMATTKAWETVERVLSTDSARALGDLSRRWLPLMTSTVQRWLDNLDALNSWCAWQKASQDAAVGGLAALVDMYERGGCRIQDLEAVFWRSFGRPWFNSVADGVDAIRNFNADSHADTIDAFKTLDRQYIRSAQTVVSARLAAAAPSTSASVSSQSELGILRRELAKKSRHLPTRRLVESMPTLLPRLKPCFLMSPLSVAQFLDSHLPPFDLVIFDEASQIPVWDAVGAIARGTEVVVVGDSKQLPPTAFFSTLDSDDESEVEEHAIEDMESILKECNASGVPSMRLRWHYRSRHETLIAFSNHHYYDNELHTFPSPEDRSERLGVSFRHIPDAVYDRGGSRTNRIEAAHVVDEVVRMLRDPECRESIGIVTFSQAQQSLVEDLLDQRRRESPEIERHFTSNVAEPVFVKNLENVQGDERDCILFSVGYGRDQTGRASMNFGPLNKDGGERRLNVAVTRARRRLMVFSSITSDDIDLRRTRATGVVHFKTFLDYAKRGPQALTAAVSLSSRRDFDSEFERAVCNALTELGWQVDIQVGCAGYRIDLAVRDPQKPGRYLIGIECDGATYHSAKTARDRDRLRQSVLEDLGWRILRVWSTDWQVNRRGCLAKLVHALEIELSSPRAASQFVAAMTQPTDAPLPSTLPEATSTLADLAPQAATSAEMPRYVPAEVIAGPLDLINVYDPAAAPHLVESLARVVAIESPITKALAMRRLAEMVGVQRVREQFRDRFDEVQRAAAVKGAIIVREDDFWSPEQDVTKFVHFRVPGLDDRSQRDLEEVPRIEVENATRFVLDQQFGLPREVLVREVARLFGFQRVSSRMSECIGVAIDRLISEGQAVIANGQIRTPHRT